MIWLVIGPVSGLLNNTAAVALMLPLVVDLSRRSGVPAGKLLIPLSFFAMLGGTLTLLGTSTNVLAAGLMADLGGPRLGMFSITVVGAAVFVSGFLYLTTIGAWILPQRRIKDGNDGTGTFPLELRIPDSGRLIGSTLESSAFLAAHGLVLRRLLRGKELVEDAQHTPLEAGDVMMVEAEQQMVLQLLRDDRVRLEFKASKALRQEVLEEGVVARVLINSSLLLRRQHFRDLDFEADHRAALVGLHHSAGEARRLGNLVVRTGQVVLMLLPRRNLQRLRRSRNLVLLEHFEPIATSGRLVTALAILLGVVLLASATPVPIELATLSGVLAMLLTRCLSPQQAYESAAWEIVLLLAGVLPLGITIAKSGTADWAAGNFASVCASWSPFWVLFGLYVLTTVLTEVVSNSAAVVILLPVARAIGLEPAALVMIVMFGASTSFLSPIGYQTNTMIYATGVYRFTDFFVVGAPLDLLTAFVTAATILHLFPVAA